MNPYLMTVAFLMLMSILTSSELNRFRHNSFRYQLQLDYQKRNRATENIVAHANLEDFQKEEKNEKEERLPIPHSPKPQNQIPRSSSLGFNLSRPPNNSRLNLYLLIHTSPHKNYPLSLYEGFARLMRKLYGQASFYRADCEYKILDCLMKEKESTQSFSYPDELANLDLGNPELQTIFYSMIKGIEEYPSLLDFITFDREKLSREKRKLNLMFADALVIESLLDHPSLTKKLLVLRATFWKEILDQESHRLEREKEICKGRNQFKNELLEEYKKILSEEGLDYDLNYKWVFDLSLGELGNILFIEEAQTGFKIREKYSSF
ncbi:MAG: hypothetical protein R3E91_03590 [Chlamydiales bacterium]